jgi:hypothetical protein
MTMPPLIYNSGVGNKIIYQQNIDTEQIKGRSTGGNNSWTLNRSMAQ